MVQRLLAWWQSRVRRFRLGPLASKSDRQQLGDLGERLAVTHLERAGYVIEKRNVRYPVGELDVVARDGGVLCFIEVRSASSTDWGGALASITYRKRRRVIRAAEWYLQHRPDAPEEVRFDVVAVQWAEQKEPTVELIKNAFNAE